MNIVDVPLRAAECQRCFTYGPERSSIDIASHAARMLGWLEIDEKTLCPDCRREKEEEKVKLRGVGK